MGKIEYSKYLIGFLDVLGTKETIRKDPIGLLNTLHREFANEIEDSEFANEFSSSLNNKVKIFSDNIVIAIDCLTCSEQELRIELQNIVLQVAWRQRSLLQQGYLSRGCITYGDCFIDDVLIMGKALVDAYKIESRVADNPRVIVDDCLLTQLNPNKKWISKDDDNLFYVDYIKMLFANNNTIFQKRVADIIEDGTHKDSKHGRPKYVWVKTKMEKYWDFDNNRRIVK